MAFTVSPIGAPLGTVVVTDTALGATPDGNVRGGSTNLYYIDADNTLNSAPTYLHLYNTASPVVGTTEPDWRFEIPANTRLPIPFPQTVPFATALSMAATTAAMNTTPPVSNFTVRLTLS